MIIIYLVWVIVAIVGGFIVALYLVTWYNNLIIWKNKLMSKWFLYKAGRKLAKSKDKNIQSIGKKLKKLAKDINNI